MDSNRAAGVVPLLYIDDSENERLLVREAILLTKTPFAFHEADSMESAIPYFQSIAHVSQSKQYPPPELVLLDYELVGHTGVDFLYWLRVLKKIKSLPVVMFSGSPGKTHVAECYEAGANHFLAKPKDLERLKRIVRALHVSLVSVDPPGPIQLLQEYRPDPRKDHG